MSLSSYLFFFKEQKPLDFNTSGDFVNFDFLGQSQFSDLLNFDPSAPMVAEETGQGECALSEASSPVKMEEMETMGGVLQAPPMSQYEQDMDQVQQLIVREVMGDIIKACRLIDIPQDPYHWNSEQVQKWVEWTRHQYRLPEIDARVFAMDGLRLCNLTDGQFRQMLPKSGDILYAHLDIWKNASRMSLGQEFMPASNPHLAKVQSEESFSYMDIGCMGGYETSSSISNSDDEASIPSPSPTGPNTYMTPNHTGGIHLWQFLKELLLQPESYCYCIRWLDRPQGIFKIEDSVEVARLWGLRKNRPAMNYDKLSRSIRQYYKKGIMKKTEVAQRLVYQFVHPC
jgi:hypothetical protein